MREAQASRIDSTRALASMSAHDIAAQFLRARRDNSGARLRHVADDRRPSPELWWLALARPAIATSTPRANTAPRRGRRSDPRPAACRAASIFLTTKVSHENLRPTISRARSSRALPRSSSTMSTFCWCTGPIRRSALRSTMPALGQGQAARSGTAHRRRQLQHRAARSGDRALSRAAGGVAGRVSSLSRSEQAAARRAPARAGVHRLLPARPRTAVQRSGAGARSRSARGRTLAQIALRWLCSRTSPPFRARQIRSASRTTSRCSISTLSGDEMARIAALKRPDGRIANPVGRVPGGWD